MKAILQLAVLFSILYCTAPSYCAIVGVDNLRSAIPSALLGSGDNFTDFRATLTSAGHTVVPLAEITPEILLALDAVILRQASSVGNVYSDSEIDAIQSFVAAGRGLIISSEGGGSTNSTLDNINSLVAPYGVTYGLTAVDPNGFTVTGFRPHPLTAGVSSIGVDFSRPFISIVSPAFDLTIDGGSSDILAVASGTGGRGNVVLLGDTSLWSNGLSDRPITFGDNRRLLLNAVAFATVPEPSSVLFGLGLVAVLLKHKRRKARLSFRLREQLPERFGC